MLPTVPAAIIAATSCRILLLRPLGCRLLVVLRAVSPHRLFLPPQWWCLPFLHRRRCLFLRVLPTFLHHRCMVRFLLLDWLIRPFPGFCHLYLLLTPTELSAIVYPTPFLSLCHRRLFGLLSARPHLSLPRHRLIRHFIHGCSLLVIFRLFIRA